MAACDGARDAGWGHPAYNDMPDDVGRVPPRGDCAPPHDVGDDASRNAGLGNPAYSTTQDDVGRVPPRGGPTPDEPPPRRLRRLNRVWPDRDGNISYLLTLCVDGRVRVLDNEATFQRQASKFPRRFSHLQRAPEDSTFQP